MKKRVEFLKKKISDVKKKISKTIDKNFSMVHGALLSYAVILLNKVNVYAEGGISDNLKNAANGAQQEVLTWVEAIGTIGIVISAVFWFAGQSKMAKTILISTVIGYILLKFAPELWTFFIGLI